MLLLREIAKGASSRVFLASDGKLVKAVKVFTPDYAEHAERELEYGGALDPPHLNPVEPLVQIEGYPAVTMPFAAGQRLGLWLDEVPAKRFLETFKGVLLGLTYLHAQDIIHRDVKPENIIVDRSAHARLLDFDLAVRAGETQRRRAVAGTVAYLSPEQAQGQPATEASDLYAAGIILYRGLTGEVPFTGSVKEVLNDHINTPPEAPSSFDKRLKLFDAFFETLLAKRPQDRFPDAAAVLEGLESVGTLEISH